MAQLVEYLSRVLDWGLKGCLFETHQSHCVLSLRKIFYLLLSTGSIPEGRNSS